MCKEITFKLALDNPDKTCEIKGEIVEIEGYDEFTFVLHHTVIETYNGCLVETTGYAVSEYETGNRVGTIPNDTREEALIYAKCFLDGVRKSTGIESINNASRKGKQINFMPEDPMLNIPRKCLVPFSNADEDDAFGHLPLAVFKKAGVRKRTKQRYNRRVRRMSKINIMTEDG